MIRHNLTVLNIAAENNHTHLREIIEYTRGNLQIRTKVTIMAIEHFEHHLNCFLWCHRNNAEKIITASKEAVGYNKFQRHVLTFCWFLL